MGSNQNESSYWAESIRRKAKKIRLNEISRQ